MGPIESFTAKGTTWTIQQATGTEQETEAAQQLKRILERHDISKWTFTGEVRIDARDVPHSHPVLTVNANYLDKDDLALAVLLHEEIHWHISAHIEDTKKAITEFRRIYPVVPTAPPEGARDEYSTYLHIIVNYLEYIALRQIVGVDDARSILELWRQKRYRWIYGKVLDDTRRIGKVIRDSGLFV
jgi:hypothetical protein